jgi:hypothetical protein
MPAFALSLTAPLVLPCGRRLCLRVGSVAPLVELPAVAGPVPCAPPTA